MLGQGPRVWVCVLPVAVDARTVDDNTPPQRLALSSIDHVHFELHAASPSISCHGNCLSVSSRLSSRSLIAQALQAKPEL